MNIEISENHDYWELQCELLSGKFDWIEPIISIRFEGNKIHVNNGYNEYELIISDYKSIKLISIPKKQKDE